MRTRTFRWGWAEKPQTQALNLSAERSPSVCGLLEARLLCSVPGNESQGWDAGHRAQPEDVGLDLGGP